MLLSDFDVSQGLNEAAESSLLSQRVISVENVLSHTKVA